MGQVGISVAVLLVFVGACRPPPRIGEGGFVSITPPGNQPGVVVTERDQFDGTVVHRIERARVVTDRTTTLDLTVIAPPEPAIAGILLSASGDRWRWLRCHSVDMLIDGQSFANLPSRHDGRVGRGYVLESVLVEIAGAHLVRIARGTDVRLRLCNEVFIIDAPTRANFLALAQRAFANDPLAPVAVAEPPPNPFAPPAPPAIGDQVPEDRHPLAPDELDEPEPEPYGMPPPPADPVPPPVYSSPQPSRRSACPGGVTTTGRCCTRGYACGGSCISTSRRCHR